MRLRSTARGSCRRDTAMPRRAMPTSLGVARTVKKRSPRRLACSNTRRNWGLSVSRAARGNRLSRVAPEAGDSRAEPHTTLGAAPGQNLPTRLGRHTGTETVSALATHDARLESSLHGTVRLIARAAKTEPANLPSIPVRCQYYCVPLCGARWLRPGRRYILLLPPWL